MEEIIFATHVSTMDWFLKRAEPLAASSKYFHPEIPFRIFGPEETEEINNTYPVSRYHSSTGIKAVIGMELSKHYKKVVIFDADSMITSTLPELIDSSFYVAGVRAFTDHGALQTHNSNHPEIKKYENISGDRQRFLNCGLVAACGYSFWSDWHNLNLRQINSSFNFDEGTFNELVRDKYSKELMIIDPSDSSYYYGTASTWGNSNAWESWETIILRDKKLYLKNIYGTEKQVKVLHEAGHGHPCSAEERFNYGKLFHPSVVDFFKKISS